MKAIVTLLALSILGCVEINPELDIDRPDLSISSSSSEELWVCHHPGTEYHNQPCVEDTYPAGCYVRGDNSKFCWVLTREDCSTDKLEGHATRWQELCSLWEM